MSIQSSTIQNPASTNKIQLSITGDKTIEADILHLPLSQLKLDPDNVRFKHVTREMSDKKIEEWIWNMPDSKSLIKEIKFSQGLTEKPVVRKIGESQYIVIEGNRRTVCLRKIADEIKSGKEKNIPIERIESQQCIVLPKDIDPSDIALYLARIHVSGKKDWAALNKGAHVWDLIKKFDYDYDEVAKAISIGKNTISLNVKAYDATLSFRQKYPKYEMWLQRFSHFLELYKRRGLKEWVDDLNNLEMFMKWVYEGKLPMAIDVRKLEKIISDGKDAYKAMQSGASISEAMTILKEDESRESSFSTLTDQVDGQVKDLYALVRNFPRSKMQDFSKNKAKLGEMETLHKEFGQLIKDIKAISAN